MLRYFQQILRIANPADRYFGMREHAGRNKTVIPVVVGPDSARIAITDEEPVEDVRPSRASAP